MQFFRDPKINFMKYRRFFVFVSMALIAVAVSELFLIGGGLNLGIDFAGGTQLTIKFDQEPAIDDIRTLIAEAGIDDAQIQRFGDAEDNEIILKTGTVEGDEEGSRGAITAALDAELNPDAGGRFDLNTNGAVALGDWLTQRDPDGVAVNDPMAGATHYETVAEAIMGLRQDRGLLTEWDAVAALPEVTGATEETLKGSAYLGSFAVLGGENVSPQIGSELRRKGILAVVSALIGMLIYIWFRFELRFGIGALVAVTHDVIVVLGLYALAGYEFNLTTIAAFLTLVGYSINDSVVVFDRVRENLRRRRNVTLETTLNESLNQTLSRTVLTSGTTLLAVGSLLFLGGDVLRGFAFILTIGVIVGTYSSIYVASPFTILWEQFFGREARARRA